MQDDQLACRGLSVHLPVQQDLQQITDLAGMLSETADLAG